MTNQKAVVYWDVYVKKSKPKVYMNLPRQLEWRKIREVFNIQPSRYPKIAELGIGSGHFATNFLREGFKVTGFDISPVSLSICRKRSLYYFFKKQLKLVQTDYSREQYINAFNAGYIIASFHCLSNNLSEQELIFKNFIKSIKKNGKIFIMEPNPYNPLIYLAFLFLYSDNSWSNWREGFNIIHSTSGRIAKLLEKYGLKSVSVHRYGFLPTSLIARFRFIEGLNEFLCRIPVINNFSLFNLFVSIKS